MNRTVIIVSATAVIALLVPDAAMAQAAGNFLGAPDVYGMGLNFVTGIARLGQLVFAAAGMWGGYKAWQANHHIWEVATSLGAGAGFFFGVPMALGIPIF